MGTSAGGIDTLKLCQKIREITGKNRFICRRVCRNRFSRDPAVHRPRQRKAGRWLTRTERGGDLNAQSCCQVRQPLLFFQYLTGIIR